MKNFALIRAGGFIAPGYRYVMERGECRCIAS